MYKTRTNLTYLLYQLWIFDKYRRFHEHETSAKLVVPYEIVGSLLGFINRYSAKEQIPHAAEEGFRRSEGYISVRPEGKRGSGVAVQRVQEVQDGSYYQNGDDGHDRITDAVSLSYQTQ